MKSAIFIEGLTFPCIIGVLPHERTTPQPLVVDAQLDFDIHPAARSGQLDTTLDYAAVCQRIEAMCIDARAELLETLAIQISDALLAETGVTRVRLKLAKPDAVKNAQQVGVVVDRSVAQSHE